MVPWEDRKRFVSRLGVVFGQRSQLWWDVPVMDSFLLLKDIYRVPEGEFRSNLDRLTEQLDLHDLLTAPVRTLSLGQKMRCEIAAALLHGPEVLFLDEPTIGLDAVSKLKVREFILEENRVKGTTVILTTHDMQDIDALCRRVLLIGKGMLLLDGPMEEIRAMAGENLSTEESVADLYRRFGI
jgi:ABC-2 type transport system ATP-binding protein